jgi:threonine/homoserine/homoserine lactone efflux protein
VRPRIVAVPPIAGFAALSLALIVVPGPSVMFVVSRAVTLGRRAALVTVVGNSTGAFVQVLLVAAGLGVVVERSIVVFSVIKLIGAGYLVYLGLKAIRGRRQLAHALDAALATGPRRSVFVDGFVVGLANPKVIVFFMSILPQFVVPRGAPAGLQITLLGAVFVSIALVSDSTWGLAAGTARQWFARSPQRLERLGATGGLVTVGLGLRLALVRHSD